jgi:hypothetical protein
MFNVTKICMFQIHFTLLRKPETFLFKDLLYSLLRQFLFGSQMCHFYFSLFKIMADFYLDMLC